MKKLILGLTIILILISSFVFAKYYSDDPRTVSYELKEGWNVVPPLPTSTNSKYVNTCGEVNPFNTSTSSLVSHSWTYSPTIKKWVGLVIDGSGTFLGENSEEVLLQIRDIDSKVPFYYTEFASSFVYSTKNCELPLDLSIYYSNWTDESLEARNFQFASGWNFVTIIPQMENKKFSDIFAECRVDKMTSWTASSQTWDPVIGGGQFKVDNIFTTEQFIDTTVEEHLRGQVLLMHFKEQCTLKMSSTPDVPAAPPTLPT